MKPPAPRPTNSYRAARRNASRGSVWPGIEATYRPYQIKPPAPVLMTTDPVTGHLLPRPLLTGFRERQQPKTYSPNGDREVARRLRQMEERS